MYRYIDGGKLRDFYPRPPRGGRPNYENQLDDFQKFLSTPSARRATSATREN